jgi:hypothetical protein
MLAEAEAGLVAVLKASPMALRLRAVGTLPGLDGKNLVQRFASDAPGAYVLMSSFPVRNSGAVLKAGVVCVARNAAGFEPARQGDGKQIGLYQIADAAAAALDQASAGPGVWQVTGIDMLENDQFYESGIQVAVVRVETLGPVSLPPLLDTTGLDDFETFHADYDFDPLATPEARAGWVAETADYSGAVPELTDTIQLQEP